MKKSILKEMVIGMAVVVAGIMSALAAVIILTEQQQQVRQYVDATNAELSHVGKAIDFYIGAVKEDAMYLAKHPAHTLLSSTMRKYENGFDSAHVESEAEKALVALYNTFEKSHPSYVAVYIGTSDGCFITGSDIGLRQAYDPRKRPWYLEAMQNPDSVTVSAVY